MHFPKSIAAKHQLGDGLLKVKLIAGHLPQTNYMKVSTNNFRGKLNKFRSVKVSVPKKFHIFSDSEKVSRQFSVLSDLVTE